MHPARGDRCGTRASSWSGGRYCLDWWERFPVVVRGVLGQYRRRALSAAVEYQGQAMRLNGASWLVVILTTRGNVNMAGNLRHPARAFSGNQRTTVRVLRPSA
jgi:hypothetical protein